MSSLTPERIAEIREEIQCSHDLTGILLMDERRLLDAFDRIAELEAEVARLQIKSSTYGELRMALGDHTPEIEGHEWDNMPISQQRDWMIEQFKAVSKEVTALREDKARLVDTLHFYAGTELADKWWQHVYLDGGLRAREVIFDVARKGGAQPVDPTRCDKCGWPLAESVSEGCVPGNCSYRPGAKGGAA